MIAMFALFQENHHSISKVLLLPTYESVVLNGNMEMNKLNKKELKIDLTV